MKSFEVFGALVILLIVVVTFYRYSFQSGNWTCLNGNVQTSRDRQAICDFCR
jgi:hypothetical protein